MVKQEKHTSGPWKAEAVEHNPGRKVYAPGLEDVPYGSVICDVHDYDTPEGCANARLIAAAPELLQSLREMVARFNFAAQNGVAVKIIERAKVAIAKAEGR